MDVFEKIKEYKFVVISLGILLIAFVIFVISIKSGNQEIIPEEEYLDHLISDSSLLEEEGMVETPLTEELTSIIVDVKGAVNNPGVYQLNGESRVIDAIDKAGGLTTEADSKTINFAKLLADEMLIYIPVEGEEIIDIPSISEDEKIGGDQVNLNLATAEQLEMLSGIGPKKAQDIILYREKEGPFKSIEELTHVSGIGDKTFEKLKDQIKVD